jgi:hypothetical protein
LNSTTKTPVVITTQFPSHPKESSPLMSVQRLTPPSPVVNGHNKQQTNIVEQKPLIKDPCAVRIDANIEIGRLEMKDLAERELHDLCELYYQKILEEVIQSDFEKPSIPEVILAVITDLTKDDEDNHQQEEIEFENHNNNSIYYFSQNKSRSNSPSIINTNGDIDHYYTNMHQTVTNNNGHETERSTDSSDQNIVLIPIIDQTSDPLQVKFRFQLRSFIFI